MAESSRTDASTIREIVRTHYAAQARRALDKIPREGAIEAAGGDACCSPATDPGRAPKPISSAPGQRDISVLNLNSHSCCGTPRDGSGVGGFDPITHDLYSSEQAGQVPAAALQASLGCGNPTALIDLRPGEIVLDLGAGGGIDIILSARRVGPTGWAYGIDMTDEMIELAHRNAADAGVANVTFLKGQIEAIPLPEGQIDVVISNCVINLAADKGPVLREAFRVLRPGGSFAVSDIVVDGLVPTVVQQRLDLWAGCIAGALQRAEYERLLQGAGFVDIEIMPTRYYRGDDLGDPDLSRWLADQPLAIQESLSRTFFSAFIRARKPGTSAEMSKEDVRLMGQSPDPSSSR